MSPDWKTWREIDRAVAPLVELAGSGRPFEERCAVASDRLSYLAHLPFLPNPDLGDTEVDVARWAIRLLQRWCPSLSGSLEARCRGALTGDVVRKLTHEVPNKTAQQAALEELLRCVRGRLGRYEPRRRDDLMAPLTLAQSNVDKTLDGEWKRALDAAVERAALFLLQRLQEDVGRLRLEAAFVSYVSSLHERLAVQQRSLEAFGEGRSAEFERIAATPEGATGNMWRLRGALAEDVRKRDAELVACWRGGPGWTADPARNQPWERRDFPRQAARAAERLAMQWLQRRFSLAEENLVDLSVRQVHASSQLQSEVCKSLLGLPGVDRGRLTGPAALPADIAARFADGKVTLFDVKNSVQAGNCLELLVPEHKRAREGVTYVGVWTKGRIEFGEGEARDLLAGTTPDVAGLLKAQTALRRVTAHVIGQADARSIFDFFSFMKTATPKVKLRLDPDRDRIPAFLFAFPEDAHAEGGRLRARAMEAAGIAAFSSSSVAAAVLWGVHSGKDLVGFSDLVETKFARWFAERLRLRPKRSAALPSLGETYVVALQALLSSIEAGQRRPVSEEGNEAESASPAPLCRLPALLERLCVPRSLDRTSPFDHQRSGMTAAYEAALLAAPSGPLGAWDPTGQFRHLVRAARLIVDNAIHLPRIYALGVTSAGTVIARSGDGGGGRSLTLLAHCAECSEWPLIWGEAMLVAGKDRNGCRICGKLVCSKGHPPPGCRCEKEAGEKGSAASRCLAERVRGEGPVTPECRTDRGRSAR